MKGCCHEGVIPDGFCGGFFFHKAPIFDLICDLTCLSLIWLHVRYFNTVKRNVREGPKSIDLHTGHMDRGGAKPEKNVTGQRLFLNKNDGA